MTDTQRYTFSLFRDILRGDFMTKGILLSMHALGTLIQAELDRRNWTQRQLAEAMGVTQPALSKLINDPERIPNLETLVSLSTALQIPLGQAIAACGFRVDRPANPDAWAEAIIASVPELRLILEPILQLPASDRDAVLSYIDNLRHRRASKKA